MYNYKTIVLSLFVILFSLVSAFADIDLELNNASGSSCSYSGPYFLSAQGGLVGGKNAYEEAGSAELYWSIQNSQWELKVFGDLIATNESDTDLDPPCLGASTWILVDNACAITTLSGDCDELNCELNVTQAVQSLCVDNGNDDYFTVTINASTVNGSGQYQVYLGGVQLGNNTNYGTAITLGDGTNGAIGTFSADGSSSYSLLVRDVSDASCFKVHTTTITQDCFVGPMAEYVIGRESGIINACEGTFADGGDLTGDYGHNRSDTLTFCSDEQNHISFSFKTFQLEGPRDKLYIYNGPNTNAPQVEGSPFTADNPADGPGTVTSTGTCMTFLFQSDGSTAQAGWEAEIFCSGGIISGAASELWDGYPYSENCSTDGQIGGTVYEDFNGNGIKNNAEPGIENITVKIFNDSGQVDDSTLTDADGEYTFNGLTDGTVYRVEFDIPNGLQEGGMGLESNSSVQFVQTDKCNAHLGLIDPNNFCLNSNPEWLIPCYINGDVQDPSNIGETGVARFLYNDSGNSPAASYINKLRIDKIGSTWGQAFKSSTKEIFITSMLKRHSGVGPAGIGAIYKHQLEDDNETVSTFYDFGASAGVIASTAVRFPGNGDSFGEEGPCGTCDNVDPTTFPQIAKVGFGDIDISADDETLYVVNLFDRKVYSLDSKNPAANSATALPNMPWLSSSICNNGTARPWALKIRRGKLYVGVICDASSSTCANDVPCADLTASVYSYDLTTQAWSLKLTFPMNYTREPYKFGSGEWSKWLDDYADMKVKVGGITDAQFGQPIFMDIEFDTDGSIIMGFGDRTGLQLGYRAPAPDEDSNGTADRVFTFGDILRASYDSNSDSYTLENNGTVGNLTTTNTNNVTGPGGKSFYWGDFWYNNFSNAGVGALAILPGSGEVMYPVGDAIRAYSNGVVWMSNINGKANRKIEIYRGSSDGNASTFAKGSGVGDIELLCDGAPLEIGNHVWWDTDLDGIQDPGETGLQNVTIKLYKDIDGNTMGNNNPNGDEVLIATTTTDAYGRYIFSFPNNDNGLEDEEWESGHTEILPDMVYNIHIEGFTQQTTLLNIKNTFGYNDINISPSQVQGDAGAARDNNSFIVGSDAVAVIKTTTFNDHSIDFGFGSASSCLVSAAPSSNTTCYGDTLKLEANPFSGAQPYEFAWDGPESFSSSLENPTISNINADHSGTYQLIIEDSNECKDTIQINVSINGFTSDHSVTDSDCSASNGAIEINASGAGTLQYDWAHIAGSNNVEDLTGLPMGTYTVTITDENLCTSVESAIIQNVNGPRFISESITHETCSANNGAISIETTAASTYTWSHGPNTEDVTGLTAGTYTVTISDGVCDAVQSYTIYESTPPSLSANATHTTCDSDNGAISLTISGGAADFAYDWAHIAGTDNTKDISDLSADTYTVIVTDANGCTDEVSIVVNASADVAITESHVDPSCGDPNGSITISNLTGTAPYNIQWSVNANSGDDDYNRTGLNPGQYTATVTDTHGCADSISVVLTNQGSPEILLDSVSHETCSSGNGFINLTITNVTAISWSNGATTDDISGLSAGTYTVTASNATCSTEITYTISDAPSPELSSNITHTTCDTDNGSISLSVSGGTADFTYNWAHIDGIDNAKDISSLAAGTYTVTVTDANGCTDVLSNVVNASTDVAITETHVDPSCGDANGSISISNLTGTAPHNIQWSVNANNGDDHYNRTGLNPGQYSATVTDAHGCMDSITVQLSNIGGPVMVLDTIEHETCSSANGSINLSISDVTTISWSNGATTDDISGLSAGTYTITATNATCSTIMSYTITDAASPALSSDITHSTCEAANGSITLSVVDGTAEFTYDWAHIDGTDDSKDISDLAAGTYHVTVTDANGCTDSESITINTSSSLSISISAENEACNRADGALDLTVTTGTPPFQYQWDNDGTADSDDTQDLENLNAGTYSVTVTDAKGCTATATSTIIDEGGPTVASTHTDNTDCGEPNGSITLNVTDGIPPYTYDWSNDGSEDPDNDPKDLSALNDGTYTVTVTDANGCSATSTSVIESADLALIKTLINPNASTKYGDTVAFEITIRNQGTLAVDSVVITDYAPLGLAFLQDIGSGGLNDGWNVDNSGHPYYSISTVLNPTDEIKTTVYFKVNKLNNPQSSDYINVAEISYAHDLLGNEIHDCDSELNDDDTDNGGSLINTPADDHWLGDGTADNPNGIESTDQDNVDPAEVCIFDLALDNKLTSSPSLYMPGDVATFTVCIYNQGVVSKDSIVVCYFIPIGYNFLAVNTAQGWTYDSSQRVATLSITSGFDDGVSLNASEHICQDIQLSINRGNMEAADHITIAEITKAKILKTEIVKIGGSYTTQTNTEMVMSDADSDYDGDKYNDAGGCLHTDSDNAISGDGSGESHSCDALTDEDDHDPARVNLPLHSIGNQVWYDANNDGLRSNDEFAIEDVKIDLYYINAITSDCELIATDTTGSDGYYLFTGLFGGQYMVAVSANNFNNNSALEDYESATGGSATSLHQGPYEDSNGPINAEEGADNDDNGLKYTSGKLSGSVVSDTITLSDDEPLSESPSNDNVVSDNRSNLTVDFGFIKKTFDLALRKEFQHPDSVYVFGDVVDFEISIFNQGNIDARNITVTEYIPKSLTAAGVSNPGWIISGDTIASYTYAPTLTAGSNTVLKFRAIFREANTNEDYINCAEISVAEDLNGNSTANGTLKDVDSTPDADKGNDTGGSPLTPADDYIWGSGQGTVGSANAQEDEDDADPAVLSFVDVALKKEIINSRIIETGDLATFRVTVYNQGSIPVKDVVIQDYLPSGLDWVSDNDGWVLLDDSTAQYTITQTLNGKDSAVIDLTLEVSSSLSSSNAVNFAEIQSFNFTDGTDATFFDIDSRGDNIRDNDAGGLKNSGSDNALSGTGTRGSGEHLDPDANTDEDDHDPACVPFLDLALIKTLQSITAPVMWNDTLRYGITVINQGTDLAQSIEIIDYIPEGLLYLKSNDHTWSLNTDGNAVALIEGGLASGDSITIYIDLMVRFGANAESLINYSEIVSFEDSNGEKSPDFDSTPDAELGNDGKVSDDQTLNADGDEDDHDIVESPVFDLALRKTISSGLSIVEVGDVVVYKIEVFNQGNVGATGIEVADFHEGGLTFYPNQNPDWKVIGDHIEYIPTLSIAPGESEEIYISMTVNSSAGNFNLLNSAEIISARDENFQPISEFDIDSKPDAIFGNDMGGLAGSATDNEINDVGIIDEDDHDTEDLTMCADIACTGRINLSLDNSCKLEITPSMLLVDTLGFDSNDYDINYFDLDGNPIESIKVNELMNVMISIPGCTNDQEQVCWSQVLVEDKLPPVLDCAETDTIFCYEMDEITYPQTADLCNVGITIEMVNEEFTKLCEGDTIIGMSRRTFRATDASGNVSDTCSTSVFIRTPKISNIDFPEDVRLMCSDSVNSIEELLAQNLGGPSFMGFDLTTDTLGICFIEAEKEDRIIVNTPCKKQILRIWSVRQLFCSNKDTLIQNPQIITLVDSMPPVISVVDTIRAAGTADFNCNVTFSLPGVKVTDICDPNAKLNIYHDSIPTFYNGSTLQLPPGTHTLYAQAMDACHNQANDTFVVIIEDETPPVTFCLREMTVSLNTNGTALIPASKFNDGSYDNCSNITIDARRMTSTCDDNTGHQSELLFCCADVATDVMVEMRATDEAGNSSICMINVNIQDKDRPSIICPPNVTINCDYPINKDNLSEFGKVALEGEQLALRIDPSEVITSSDVLVDGVVFAMCMDSVSETSISDINECGAGTFLRTFTAHTMGAQRASCVQTISIVNDGSIISDPVVFPNDTIIISCDTMDARVSITGYPFVEKSKCNLIGYSNTDKIVTPVDTTLTCVKILRTWKIFESCGTSKKLIDAHEQVIFLQKEQGTNNVLISGIISTTEDEAVSEASVKLMTTNEQELMADETDNDGYYLFTDMGDHNDYVVKPYKNHDWTNGVSTIDLIHIQNHILGTNQINNGYDMVAADVNNDKVISAVDLVLLRKLILGIDQDVKGNTSWRFVWEGDDISSKMNLSYPITEAYEISDLSGTMDIKWDAIKVGDLTKNARANGISKSRSRSSGETLSWQAKRYEGQTVIEFFLPATAHFNGIQGEFILSEGATILQMGDGQIKLTSQNVKVDPNTNSIRLSYNTEFSKAINEDTPLFSFIVTGPVFDIEMKENNISSEYYKNLKSLDFDLEKIHSVDALESLKNDPNPWSEETNITFQSTNGGEGTLRIYDVQGKMLLHRKVDLERGSNILNISKSELSSSGVLFYEIEHDDSILTQKMIKLK